MSPRLPACRLTVCVPCRPAAVVADYTFLCALHPSMRQDWAASWAKYLAPGGRLVCLEFPMDPETTGCPPWNVTPELYRELLLPAGFVEESWEAVPVERSHPKRGGREALGVFVRQ